jgi:hypothetical protein
MLKKTKIKAHKMEHKTDTATANPVVELTDEQKVLVVKTLRLPRYLADGLRNEAARLSNNNGKGRVTEQQIIADAIKKHLNL